MIIALRTDRYAEVIDAVVQNYSASYPVVSDGVVVGSAWLTSDPGAAQCLVVLDTVEPGALEKWERFGYHVLFHWGEVKRGEREALVPEDVLLVTDVLSSTDQYCAIMKEQVDEMAEVCEDAFLG